MKTKKLGVSAKFGARYGKKVRDTYSSVMKKQKNMYVCPRCGKRKVKRVGYAIFECQACGYRFTGGAYTPNTELGKVANRIIGSNITGKEAEAEIEQAEEEGE